MSKETIKRQIDNERKHIDSYSNDIKRIREQITTLRERKRRENERFANQLKSANTPGRKATIRNLKRSSNDSITRNINYKKRDIDYKKSYIERSKNKIKLLREKLKKTK